MFLPCHLLSQSQTVRYQLEALPGQGIRPHALGLPPLFLCHLMGQATPIVEKNPPDHTFWAHSHSSPHSTNVQEQLVLRVTWGLEGTVGFHGAETNTQPTSVVAGEGGCHSCPSNPQHGPPVNLSPAFSILGPSTFPTQTSPRVTWPCTRLSPHQTGPMPGD